jgi:hypothetical protein
VRLRTEAGQGATPQTCHRLERIARVYDRLATSVEKEMKLRPAAEEPVEPAGVVKAGELA